MSAPVKKGGYSQLAVFVPTDVKNELVAIAALDQVKQVQVVEAALKEYCGRRRAAHAPTKKASAA